ncbi:hypothetical protein LguiA_033071 [Lonicera macranthoides]
MDGLSDSHITAQFLHKELPIKIARRAIELQTLPSGLSQKPYVLKACLWCWVVMRVGFALSVCSSPPAAV